MIGNVNSQQGIARGKLIVVLFVVAVLAIVGITLYSSSSSGKKQIEQRSVANPTGYRAVADQFMKALSANKADEAFALMTVTSQESVGGLEAWRKTVQDSFGTAKTSPVFVSALDIQDAQEVYKGKEPRLITYKLELFNTGWETSLMIFKDNDSWKINTVVTEPT